MTHDLDRLRSYLDGIGLADVQHTHDDLLSHLVGTYRELARLNLPEHVSRAGLFHSVYGTEGFPRQSVPLSQRDDVRALIGSEAERLAYRYCAMSYDSLQRSVDEGRPLLDDRFTGEPMNMTRAEFDEVLWIKLADAVEQADETTPHSRFFRTVADLLGPDGASYWTTFARASHAAG
ncbi:DUF6817 domain-containing protein [Rubrivirga sp. IMCC45206]|uniref:DUF6817 domain-containing protein n=1 Tax=Rubrivirga sp. IMCC45206 TaxID=3391614 RepID=UPI00398FEF1B